MESDKQLATLRDTLDGWFENAMRTVGFQGEPVFDLPSIGMQSAPMNITESDKQYRITLELPGIDREELSIELREGGIEVHGEHTEEYRNQNERVYRLERSNKDYYRFIRLPANADIHKADAKLHNGELRIIVPKHKYKDAKTSIEVK